MLKSSALRMALIAATTLVLPLTSAQSQSFSEDFEGTFPAWESGWFGANTDALNYYCPSRGCAERGNNPDGLWLRGIGEELVSDIEVNFLNGFGNGITSFSLGVAGFSPIFLQVFDVSGIEIFNQSVALTSGAFTDPGTYSNLVINSSNGISRFRFNGAASGNTSIDNLLVEKGSIAVPEPSSYALVATGLFALVVVARRRRSL